MRQSRRDKGHGFETQTDVRILSWNLLKQDGAGTAEISRLVARHRPDLLLMQEATASIDALPALIGGHYVRRALPRRSNGPAAWSEHPFEATTQPLPVATRLDLPVPVFRAVLPRHALVVRIGSLQVATVHLDHGQWANRRQLRHLLAQRPGLDLVIGDFNALGGIRLPGFADVGPRRSTHRAYRLVPLRLDRCLLRGRRCLQATALAYGHSDHRPILIEIEELGHTST